MSRRFFEIWELRANKSTTNIDDMWTSKGSSRKRATDLTEDEIAEPARKRQGNEPKSSRNIIQSLMENIDRIDTSDPKFIETMRAYQGIYMQMMEEFNAKPSKLDPRQN